MPHIFFKTSPNCMSRQLLKHLEEFSAVSPRSLCDFAIACVFRFANSAREYLLGLWSVVRGVVGRDFALRDLAAGVFPGPCGGVPILKYL